MSITDESSNMMTLISHSYWIPACARMTELGVGTTDFSLDTHLRGYDGFCTG